MIELLLSVGPDDLIDLTRDAINDLKAQLFPVGQQIRRQSSANQCGNRSLFKPSEELEGFNIFEPYFQPFFGIGRPPGNDQHR